MPRRKVTIPMKARVDDSRGEHAARPRERRRVLDRLAGSPGRSRWLIDQSAWQPTASDRKQLAGHAGVKSAATRACRSAVEVGGAQLLGTGNLLLPGRIRILECESCVQGTRRKSIKMPMTVPSF